MTHPRAIKGHSQSRFSTINVRQLGLVLIGTVVATYDEKCTIDIVDFRGFKRSMGGWVACDTSQLGPHILLPDHAILLLRHYWPQRQRYISS